MDDFQGGRGARTLEARVYYLYSCVILPWVYSVGIFCGYLLWLSCLLDPVFKQEKENRTKSTYRDLNVQVQRPPGPVGQASLDYAEQ